MEENVERAFVASSKRKAQSSGNSGKRALGRKKGKEKGKKVAKESILLPLIVRRKATLKILVGSRKDSNAEPVIILVMWRSLQK